MAFFSNFPKVLYDIKGDGTTKILPDIFRRIKIRSKVKDAYVLLDKYDVEPGESPETVAFKVYGSTDYWWVVCLTNNIVNRYYDWPMAYQQFEDFVKSKYANPDAIHHYEKLQASGHTTPEGPADFDHYVEVNSDDPQAQSVSNYEYEQRLQDKKRQIEILNPSYLPMFLNEFRKLIRR
jgi:hypothetical protein